MFRLYMYSTRSVKIESSVSSSVYVCVSPSWNWLLNAALKTGEQEHAAALWTGMFFTSPLCVMEKLTILKKCGALFEVG